MFLMNHDGTEAFNVAHITRLVVAADAAEGGWWIAARTTEQGVTVEKLEGPFETEDEAKKELILLAASVMSEGG